MLFIVGCEGNNPVSVEIFFQVFIVKGLFDDKYSVRGVLSRGGGKR